MVLKFLQGKYNFCYADFQVFPEDKRTHITKAKTTGMVQKPLTQREYKDEELSTHQTDTTS